MTKQFGGESVAVAAENAVVQDWRIVLERDGGAIIVASDGMHLARLTPAGVNRGLDQYLAQATPRAVSALLHEYDEALADAEGCGETDPAPNDWPLPPGYEAALNPIDETGRMVGAHRCDPLPAEIVP